MHVQHALWPECLQVGQHLVAKHFSHSSIQWLAISQLSRSSGVHQSSPLSPLLHVLAAQPLASHLRQQARLGIVRPICMPNGQPAPVSHQHADDTSLHVLQPSDAQVAIDSSIALFCAASCSQLNASKSQVFLVEDQPLSSATVSVLPATASSQGSKRSGIWGSAWGTACKQLVSKLFTGICHAIKAMVSHWSAHGLSILGRVLVTKQVFAASLWYHATFQRLVHMPTQVQALQTKPRCLACWSLSSWLGKSFRPTILAWRLSFSTWHMGPASSSAQSAPNPCNCQHGLLGT